MLHVQDHNTWLVCQLINPLTSLSNMMNRPTEHEMVYQINRMLVRGGENKLTKARTVSERAELGDYFLVHNGYVIAHKINLTDWYQAALSELLMMVTGDGRRSS